MDAETRARLEAAGFHETTVQELFGRTPEENELIETRMEGEIAAANARLRRHIVSLGYAAELGNESLDADLAREYTDNHQVPCREDNPK